MLTSVGSESGSPSPVHFSVDSIAAVDTDERTGVTRTVAVAIAPVNVVALWDVATRRWHKHMPLTGLSVSGIVLLQ